MEEINSMEGEQGNMPGADGGEEHKVQQPEATDSPEPQAKKGLGRRFVTSIARRAARVVEKGKEKFASGRSERKVTTPDLELSPRDPLRVPQDLSFEEAHGDAITRSEEREEQAKPQTGEAIWKNKDSDTPVTVVEHLGTGQDGREYVRIKGTDTGIPLDEIEFPTEQFEQQAERGEQNAVIDKLVKDFGKEESDKDKIDVFKSIVEESKKPDGERVDEAELARRIAAAGLPSNQADHVLKHLFGYDKEKRDRIKTQATGILPAPIAEGNKTEGDTTSQEGIQPGPVNEEYQRKLQEVADSVSELLPEAPVVSTKEAAAKERELLRKKYRELKGQQLKLAGRVIGWTAFISLMTAYLVLMASFASLRRFGSGGMGRSR
ncbi:MAG: hypothetical protein ACREHC_08525 [Candidatus Levyibacteriota bacterium]